MATAEKRTLRVTQIKSIIATPPVMEKTLRALGLRRIGMSNDLPDNPAVRGMIFQVKHLVKVEEL